MSQSSKKLPPIPEYDYLKAASAQDLTGLIPAAPQNEEEVENYEELYPFLPTPPVNPKRPD